MPGFAITELFRTRTICFRKDVEDPFCVSSVERAMRIILSALVAVSALTLTYPALACGRDTRDTNDVRFDQDEVAELRAQAVRLETSASSKDAAAMSMDRRADALMARARELRTLASQAIELDHVRLTSQASQVAAQAAVVRARAQEQRAEAAQLRVSARELRERAARLAGGRPGGWRGPGAGPVTTL
jgi:hypothetical protein